MELGAGQVTVPEELGARGAGELGAAAGDLGRGRGAAGARARGHRGEGAGPPGHARGAAGAGAWVRRGVGRGREATGARDGGARTVAARRRGGGWETVRRGWGWAGPFWAFRLKDLPSARPSGTRQRFFYFF